MEGQAGKLVNRFLRSCGFGSHSRQVAVENRTGTSASTSSLEDCLDCPVCWESFNGGENSPYVLFCGHTLCKTCLMGLQWASIRIPSLQIQLPLLVACPWCQFLSLRLYWKGGRLKFPCKNFFLLSVVESVKGSTQTTSKLENIHEKASEGEEQRSKMVRLQELWRFGFSVEQRRDWNAVMEGFSQGDYQLMKLMSLILQFVAKLPLVCLMLFMVLYVVPFSVLVLVFYCLATIVIAVPAYLVLYFSYPTLQWLAREIAAA